MAVPTVTRTIALLADQTLDDLHHAIRDAHGWDDDHLFAFWLNGRYWADDGSEYTHPLYAEMPDVLAAYTGAAPKNSAAIPLARLRRPGIPHKTKNKGGASSTGAKGCVFNRP